MDRSNAYNGTVGAVRMGRANKYGRALEYGPRVRAVVVGAAHDHGP